MCDACNEQFAVDTWGDGSPAQPLYCEVCDRDASDTAVIARWRDGNVCTDCLAHWYEMEEQSFWDAEEETP
jgi:hypothetical protein